ncbi:hypothetical protein IV203_000058 [Nitzschia inconspicua]|uniref:Uncharacterized protein n=1 Tax=Nitzschia inconspicua TaxID=303405 RepID=A0A9K3L4Q7_9STRA|nr:hypothetical protein IV203_000058 [Nitzschia inconspicua]
MVPATRLLLYMPWPQPIVSCVEKPVQCLFYALAARLGYRTYGGDAQDAFAPSPGPIVLGASIIAEQQSKRSEAAVARRQSERTMIQIPLWPPDKTADKTVPQHLQQETRDLTAVVIRSSISSLDGPTKEPRSVTSGTLQANVKGDKNDNTKIYFTVKAIPTTIYQLPATIDSASEKLAHQQLSVHSLSVIS